jgi:hypothetical protein
VFRPRRAANGFPYVAGYQGPRALSPATSPEDAAKSSTSIAQTGIGVVSDCGDSRPCLWGATLGWLPLPATSRLSNRQFRPRISALGRWHIPANRPHHGSELSQHAMHQRNRDRAFAYRRGHALHIARANISYGKHSGQARLEHLRYAWKRPMVVL